MACYASTDLSDLGTCSYTLGPKTRPDIRQFRGRVFKSQGNNKYQWMPKTTSKPRPHPDIRVISGRVLGPGHCYYYYYTLSSQRLFIREKLLLGRDLEFMYSPYNNIVSPWMDGARTTRIKKMEYKCV